MMTQEREIGLLATKKLDAATGGIMNNGQREYAPELASVGRLFQFPAGRTAQADQDRAG